MMLKTKLTTNSYIKVQTGSYFPYSAGGLSTFLQLLCNIDNQCNNLMTKFRTNYQLREKKDSFVNKDAKSLNK